MLHRSLSRMVGFRTLAPNAFSTFGWVYITALMVCYGQTNMVTESAIPGVTLIGPTDSRFDTSVSHLVSGNTVALAAIQPALPFSVVIMNSGSHTFRYYVVRFAFVTATGKRLASVSSVDLRDNDLRIRPNKVVPGSFRLVSIVPQFSRAVASGRAPQLATMRFYPDLLRSLHVYDAANNVVAS